MTVLKKAYIFAKGGSREFSYFPDETSVKLGAEVVNFSTEEKKLILRILVYPQKSTNPVFKEENSLKIPAGEKIPKEQKVGCISCPHLEDAIIPEFILTKNVPAGFSLPVEIEISADGRCRFGEKLRFTLVLTE